MNINFITKKIDLRLKRIAKARGDFDLNPNMSKPSHNLVPAAVLVPLILRPNGVTVMLTKRTNNLTNHPGQISFPGGHVDPGDKSAEEAALREMHEEVGIAFHKVEILGSLDIYETRTGFSVMPIIGSIRPPLKLVPDPSEVAEIFEVPLSFLMDAKNHKKYTKEFKGENRQFYAMPYGKHFIWGATAGMIMNLYEILTTV